MAESIVLEDNMLGYLVLLTFYQHASIVWSGVMCGGEFYVLFSLFIYLNS